MTQAMAGCPCWWAGVAPSTWALSLLTHDAALDRIHEARAGTYAEPLVEDLDREGVALRRALDADADPIARRTHIRLHETGQAHRDRGDDHDHDG